jgi:hypothetical protein
MGSIKGAFGCQEFANAFVLHTHQGKRVPPKKTMVDQKHLRTMFHRFPECQQAGISGRGNTQYSIGPGYLQSIQRIVGNLLNSEILIQEGNQFA